MAGEKLPGKVVTFYSYKGGVGRTMALTHVAWILASCDYRVLVVDWDLEAPGMTEYLLTTERRRTFRRPGVVQLIKRYADAAEAALLAAAGAAGAADAPPGDEDDDEDLSPVDLVRLNEEHLVRRGRVVTLPEEQKNDLLAEFHSEYLDDLTNFHGEYTKPVVGPDGIRFEFMPAGDAADRNYHWDLHSIDLSYMRNHLGGDLFLEHLRKTMTDAYDVVLIDSRTGMTANAITTTTVLADVVVTLFTANNQNLDRSLEAAEWIRYLTGDLGRTVQILPVPARLESAGLVSAERFRLRYEEMFSDFVSLDTQISRAEYWRRIPIPYDRNRSYFESPPDAHPDAMLHALEFLAQTLTQDPAVRLKVRNDRWESFRAQFQPAAPDPAYQVIVLVHTGSTQAYAAWISWLLRAHALDVETHEVDAHDVGRLRTLLERANGSDNDGDGGWLCIIPLLDADYLSSAAGREIWDWAGLLRTTQGDRRVLSPIRTGLFEERGAFTDGMPYLDLVGRDRQYARTAILGALGTRRGSRQERIDLAAEEERTEETEPPFPYSLGGDQGLPAGVTPEPTQIPNISAFGAALDLARREPRSVLPHLYEAESIGRRRGDLVAVSRARYLRSLEETEQVALSTLSNEAIPDVLRLPEVDSFIRVSGPEQPGPELWRTFVLSSRMGANLRELHQAMGRVHGRLQEFTQSTGALLARAAVLRSMQEYSLARRLCLDAHDGSIDAAEEARCDLELAITDMSGGRAGSRLEQAESIGQDLRDVRETTSDQEVIFQAHLYEGLTWLRHGREKGNSGYRLAAASFASAADMLSTDLAANETSPELAIRAYRLALVNVYQVELFRVSRQTADGQQPQGFPENPNAPYTAALGDIDTFWPVCSLPLAYALEQAAEDPQEPAAHRQRHALRALWIYYACGSGADLARCGQLAARQDADPNADETTPWLSDRPAIRRLIEAVRQPDRRR